VKIKRPSWIKETVIAASFPIAAHTAIESEAAIKIAKDQSQKLQDNFS
jgi:hypothetical protein